MLLTKDKMSLYMIIIVWEENRCKYLMIIVDISIINFYYKISK